MWELAIIFDLLYEDYFLKASKRIQKVFTKQNIVCSLEKEGKEGTLLLACDEKNKYKMTNLLDDILSNFFAVEYKENYIRNHLKLNRINDMQKETFLKAMVCFDLEYDKAVISKKLNYKNKIYLNSFFAFSCKSIKNKWLDICELTNDNADFLQENNIFSELLKFLIQNLKFYKNNVKVNYKKNHYEFLDEDNKKIKLNKLKSDKNEISLITNLIRLNPKCIDFYYDKTIQIDTLELVSALFEERLNLIEKE